MRKKRPTRARCVGVEPLPGLTNGLSAAPQAARVIVSAVDELTYRRVATAVAAAGIELTAEVKAPGELAEADPGADSILVFACDVEQAARIAELRRVRRSYRTMRIVCVSPPTSGTGVRRALEAGSDAVVFEPELEATLAITVLAVAAGQSAVPRRLRASMEKPALSNREKQVLRLMAEGLTNAEIADNLFLSVSTIKSHISTTFVKLGVRSRREAAALFLDPEEAARAGLLGASPPTLAATSSNPAPR